ncbi:MAG TPA: triose-phosphate isomerase, partial [Alphaproteobacteria bacterium]|nr:triose-phosphate isomerase [Alphaproteobacteria bacterium]
MKIIAGNWKMNGSVAELDSMISVLNEIDTENNVIICVPFTMLNCKKSDRISIGAQDVSTHEHGAYTGEVSAKMIAESGAKYVIVGHSERRQYHNETNDIVNQKALRVLESGLMPIVCVGETLDQKNAGQTFSVIENQVTESTKGLENYILA